MKPTAKYRVIGIMSGTSLDGLDLVCCDYQRKKGRWTFDLIVGETIKYTQIWTWRLSNAHLLPGVDLQKLDYEFGNFIGIRCKQFIEKHKIKKVDFIASHGHTVFHQPEKKLTHQIGNGVAIFESSKLPVINDFRSLDVLKGGQGAPLVPVGDHHLFADFDVCLNLGGIANYSLNEKKKRVAADICFTNMGLNYLAGKMEMKFDKNGKQAAQGVVDVKMLMDLKTIYGKWKSTRPSLGRESFEMLIKPLLDNENISIQNRLRTFCESVSIEIESVIPKRKKKLKVLATGGGAFNQFLIEILQSKVVHKAVIIVPHKKIVNYKEAIVFGLLGMLRLKNKINVLKSVTGASTDTTAGTMIGF
ncbi:MAG TPA: anhydro-N-acetylmuramic acid kinase [Cyclobacteriaceae bacterium]